MSEPDSSSTDSNAHDTDSATSITLESESRSESESDTSLSGFIVDDSTEDELSDSASSVRTGDDIAPRMSQRKRKRPTLQHVGHDGSGEASSGLAGSLGSIGSDAGGVQR